MFQIFTRVFGIFLIYLSLLAFSQISSGFSSGFTNTHFLDIAILISLIISAVAFSFGKKIGVYFFLVLTLIDVYLAIVGLSNHYNPNGKETIVLFFLLFFSSVFIIFRNKLTK